MQQKRHRSSLNVSSAYKPFYCAANQAVDLDLTVVVRRSVQSISIFFVQPLSGSGMSCQQSRTATEICVEQHHFTIFDVPQLAREAESEIEGRLQSLYFGYYTVYNRTCKAS